MRLRILGISLAASCALYVSLGACASAAPRAIGARCAPTVTDTAYLAYAPVYRACALDRVARLRPSGPPDRQAAPTFSGASESCDRANLEFVVDTDGAVIANSIRVVSTNDDRFADANVEKVSTWSYEPAMIDGRKVRQIVAFSPRLQLVNVSGAKGPVLMTPGLCNGDD